MNDNPSLDEGAKAALKKECKAAMGVVADLGASLPKSIVDGVYAEVMLDLGVKAGLTPKKMSKELPSKTEVKSGDS